MPQNLRMKTSPSILVIGDSHTRAIANGYTQLGVPGTPIEIHWLKTEKNGTTRGELPEAEALEKIAALEPDDLLVVSLHGTYHNVVGLLQHDTPFWVCGTDDTEPVPRGHVLITRSAFQETFRHRAARAKRVAGLLKACRARKVHLMTPPPKGDTAYIESRLQKYRERVVSDVGVTDAVVRMRLWQLEADALREVAAAEGAELVMPPPECVDPGGFLSPAYYGPDATHANAAYGASVLRQLVAMAAPT
jgi:hypothetical protein